MKWIYGRQDWKILERGLENCYLLTNGLGGFSSLTMTGAVARNDHSVFMACTKAPNHRINMIHRMKEELDIGESKYVLSTQEFADGTKEEGYRYLTEFSFEILPSWRYLINCACCSIFSSSITFIVAIKIRFFLFCKSFCFSICFKEKSILSIGNLLLLP